MLNAFTRFDNCEIAETPGLASRRAICRSHERVISELNSRRLARDAGPFDRHVNVRRDVTARVRRWTNRPKLEVAGWTRSGPALEPPHLVGHRAIESLAVRVIGEHDGAVHWCDAVSGKQSSVENQRDAGFGGGGN